MSANERRALKDGLIWSAALRPERLTLAVLMCGVTSLALSDFVSPFYWGLSVLAAALRLWFGPKLALSEKQASFIGWAGFFWVALELLLGQPLVVAFTDFLLILALAVVVEAATPRNHLHRMLVGLFLVLAAAVLTDSVLFALPLTALMWFFWRASSCLYGLNWPGGNLDPTPALPDMRWMLAMAAISLLLFVTLPRFGFHSLIQPTQPRLQTSGFSDQVDLGDFARELDARVMMRVESATPDEPGFEQQIQGRYWRGVALSRFTGKGWQMAAGRAGQSWSTGQDVILSAGDGMSIAVYREASDHAFIQLPADLLKIRKIPQAMLMDDTGALKFSRAPSRRLRLLMQVGQSGSLPLNRPPLASESDIRQIPPALSDWVTEISAGSKNNSDAIRQISAELRSWTYDLNVAFDNSDPVASFLQQKRGHCELYATTLALAARSLGIPARLVNGYYGGEWNEMGGFLLIRQQHAHSWVELWLDGHWQSEDATPASRWLLTAVRFPAADALWETVKLGWYRYVLEFQNSDRARLLLGLWQHLKNYALMLLALAAMSGLLIVAWRLAAQYCFKQRASWSVLDHWLSRHAIKRAVHQPLREVTPPQDVELAAWNQFVRQWEFQAYGGEKSWGKSELKRHLRALKA